MVKGRYHLVLGVIVGDLHHRKRVLKPRPSGFHEPHAWEPFREAPKDREKVHRECAWDRRSIEVCISLFNEIDKRVVSLFPDINAICQLQDYPTG